jgi:StAR-related lipid transfer protein 10
MLVSSYIFIFYKNGVRNVYNFAVSCPVPLKNRDFVLQRSWLDMGSEKIIMNHSVNHKDYKEKSNYVRGISYITGNVYYKIHKNYLTN